MSNPKCRVIAATITHGQRWQFLEQVVSAVMNDEQVVKLIIIDNGSKDRELIRSGVAKYGERVRIVTHEKNEGSAGGFAAAIKAAREEEGDHVLLLDDDSVPEENFVDKYLAAKSVVRNSQAIIAGARSNVGTTKTFFNPKVIYPPSWYRKTFFEVFSGRKIWRRVREFCLGDFGEAFVPIIPVKAFVYGGAFIPMEVVKKAPLPDTKLFLYGDDIDYAWGIEAMGCPIYASATPSLYDVDMTFAGSHITGLFEENVPLWKVYYRLRNMVRLSVKHKDQSAPVLLLNVAAWFGALLVIGLIYTRGRSGYWKRARIIIAAAVDGFDSNKEPPSEARI